MLRIQQRTFSTARTLYQTSSKKPLFQNPKVVTTDDNKVKIEPIKRTGEDLFTKRQRLTYQSRKRGILETDLLLSRFSKKYLTTFNEDELNQYDTLLDELDWDIYYWATRNYDVTPLPEKYKDSSVLKLLQEFSENKERVVMRMPDLDGTGH